MPKQTKIKELIKGVGLIRTSSGDNVSDWDWFKSLRKRIKYLRKENKRLKKHTGGNLKTIALLANRPVADFKCAKTNKPEKAGDYGVIVSDGASLSFGCAYWTENKWRRVSEVLAFTETDPQHIFDALNKEK